MIKHWISKVRERTGGAFVKKDVFSVDFVLDEILGIGRSVWPVIREDLHEVFDSEINEVIKLDGVGSGKSAFTDLAICTSLAYLSLVEDPGYIFAGNIPRSKVAIVIMSLREMQARSIIFDKVVDRLKHSSWFAKNYPHREKGSTVIEFPNRVFVMSGSSSETVPIGFDVLVGATDESDWFMKKSHIGDSMDQAENVYGAMKDRIETRFGDRGLMILVSSARDANGFVVKRYDDTLADGQVYHTRRPQWEAKPGNWSPFFRVDLSTVKVVEEGIPGYEALDDKYVLVPHRYRAAFDRNPRKFLRDRASILLISTKAFVLRPDAIMFSQRPNPVMEDGTLAPWFQPDKSYIYYSHNDLGETRDKCSLCLGHQVGDLTVIDLIYVINPKEEGKVDFSRVRDIIYELQRRGYPIGLVTFDSWQSRDTIQQLMAHGIPAEIMSVDKDSSAYDMWLEAHYSNQLDVYEVPGYMDCVKSLILKGRKVDHRTNGEKDITDSVAGTTKLCRSRESAGPAYVNVVKAPSVTRVAPEFYDRDFMGGVRKGVLHG